MKYSCLSSAAAVMAAAAMAGCTTYPPEAADASDFQSPAGTSRYSYYYRDVSPRVVYSEPAAWYYDANTGYYYSRPYYYDTYPHRYQAPRVYYDAPRAYPSSSAGTVERIEVVRRGDGSDIAGTIIGGVVGGVIGHEISGGSTAATVVGAAGGAVVGYEVGRRVRADEAFRVTVLLDSGAHHTVMLDRVVDLRTGDRVRLEGNTIFRG